MDSVHLNEAEEALLYRFIRKWTSEAEYLQVKTLIMHHEGWKKAYEDMCQEEAALRNLPLEQPSLRFVQNTMDAVSNAAPAKKKRHPGIWIIPFILFTTVGLLLLFGDNLQTAGSSGEWSVNYRIWFDSVYFTVILMIINVFLWGYVCEEWLWTKWNRHHFREKSNK